MSLFKQLFIAILTLMLIYFAGSFLVAVESSREQQVNQLQSHAQDAATALGLTLSTHFNDPAMMELVVSSIFDSGYFKSIRILDQESGQPLAERTGVPVKAAAPGWFAGLVRLQPAIADAYISDGWRQAGRVEVISHPVFAIDKLWKEALGNLLWLALIGTISLLLGVLFLRYQLRPLDSLVAQSQAIARREFLSIPLPRTPEFHRVVSAMNQMAEKLKSLFEEESARSEKLHAEAYKDSLTGLPNRRHFDQQLSNRLTGEDLASSGYLLIVQLRDLAELNRQLGGQRTDQLLVDVANRLQDLGKARLPLARTRGGEFTLLGLGLQAEEAGQLAEQILQALAQLHQTLPEDCLLTTHVGLTSFAPGEELPALYRRLDHALTTAMEKGPHDWADSSRQQHGQGPAFEELRRHWYELLDGVLAHKNFQLFFQPVVRATDTSQVWHHKILARIPDAEGELLPAGIVIPWLERFGWMARLDMGMLEHAFTHLRKYPQPIAVSLSGRLLEDPDLLRQLYRLLERNRDLSGLMTLELDESQLPTQDKLEALTQLIQELGFGLALQHFGGRFSMIGNLSRLQLSYLKVDGSYIRAIDVEADKKLFIEAMQRAADSIDLPLIAERVETPGESRTLTEMGIAGMQGQLFGEPAPWQQS